MTRTARATHVKALERRLADVTSAIPGVPFTRPARLAVLVEERAALCWALGTLRAERRVGELLKAIKANAGGRPEKLGGSSPQVSRSQAARDAGMSRDQKRTALRVANGPAEECERRVRFEKVDGPPIRVRVQGAELCRTSR